MRVLVTGGSGFLGSWVSGLLSLDHEVMVLGRPDSSYWRLQSLSSINVVRASEKEWSNKVNQFEPDAILLFDWQGVENAYRNDTSQFNNIERWGLLLNGLTGNPRIVGVGSQAEVGPCAEPISETQPDNPTTQYGEAKIAAREFLFNSAPNMKNVHWARIFSTYGNLDNGTWFLPTLIKNLMAGSEFQMTPGEQRWSYLHAFDLANAFKYIVEKEMDSPIINVGNPNTVVLRELALSVGELLEAENLIKIGAIDYRPDQVMKLQPICDSLTSLGWAPEIDLITGARSLITEYQGAPFDMKAFIEKQQRI
jgi:UDP-glucose 4-epimerase